MNNVRKDEYNRLINEKKFEEANILKNSKYILTSSKETLKQKDLDVKNNKEIRKESKLFNIDKITRKGSYEERYNEIIKSNELLFVADLIKEKIRLAYSREDSKKMIDDIADIIMLCNQTNNSHFKWFRNLIINHFSGIITHSKYKISSGKIEGINNKIKTLRREAYGYPDDEYFFLKLLDASRN